MRRRIRAFSLVEVVLALALVAFCLITVLSLLPAGLTTAKNTRQQTAAASVAERIATSIRNASTNNLGNYAAAGLWGGNLTWALGGATPVSTNCYFTLGGDILAANTQSQLTAEVVVQAPASASSLGTALISVAWPQEAKWQAATTNWANAAGSVDLWINFVPHQ